VEQKFSRYKFPEDVVERLTPLVHLVDKREQRNFERCLGELTLRWLHEIKQGRMTASQVDQFFTLLDLYLGDQGNFFLSQEAEDLMVEGMILHDLGKPFGADIALMEQLAQDLIS